MPFANEVPKGFAGKAHPRAPPRTWPPGGGQRTRRSGGRGRVPAGGGTEGSAWGEMCVKIIRGELSAILLESLLAII